MDTKLWSVKQIGRAIGSVSRRSRKLVEDTHVVACHVAVHAIVYGDTTLATRLVSGVHKGVSRRALVAWLSEHAPMHWENKKEEFKFQPKRHPTFDVEFKDVQAGERLLETYLNGKRFYDREPGLNQLEVDVVKLLRSVVTRAHNAEEKGREVKNAHVLPEVAALLEKIEKRQAKAA